MQPRERNMAIAIAALLALMGLIWGYQVYAEGITQKQQQVNVLRKKLQDKQAAKAKLMAWQHRSLPTNKELGRSAYQNWLFSCSKDARLADFTLNTNVAVGPNQVFEKLICTVSAHGTIEQLTQFLFEFYAKNHLQQIRRLSVKPAQNSKRLDISMTIEALTLPGADRKDELNKDAAPRTASADFADYRQSIVARNLFAEYAPPPPPRSEPPPRAPDPPKPSFDVAKYAYVTAILEVDHDLQVWLNIRTTGETLKLREGDRFDVGGYQGQIARIGERDIEFRSGDKRYSISVGDNLRSAAVVGEGELEAVSSR